MIRHLLGKAPHTIASEDKPHIIVARNLTPSDTASINRAFVLGFATEQEARLPTPPLWLARWISQPSLASTISVRQFVQRR